MIVLIDNGHGANTPGKCSPNKQIREYSYTREIASLLEQKLKEKGITAIRIVTEENDVPLSTRVQRVNTICKEFGAKNCCVVSIHLDACPPNDGKWHNARGFSVRVAKSASSRSKKLARLLYEQAEALNLKGNRSVPPEKYWVQNLAICRDTNCAAVLTENLFQDNKDDVAFLLSKEGKDAIVQLHLNGIINYIEENSKISQK
jgi:N-acetylmuramoyl-L-alanine amidase